MEVCKETFNNCLSLIEKDGDSKDIMLEKAISWYLAILLKSPELDNDKIDTLLNVKETEDCKNLKNVLDFINNKCISKNGIYKPIGILKNIEDFNFGGNVFLDETHGTNESKFVTYLRGR